MVFLLLIIFFITITLLLNFIIKFLMQRTVDIQEKYLGEAISILDAMFIYVTKKQLITYIVFTVLVMLFISFIVTKNITVSLFVGIIGIFIPKLIINYFKNKRLENFDNQLMDGIEIISNSMRAGLSLPQAIGMITEQLSPPITQEFGLLLRENKLGIPLEKALENLRDRVNTKEINILVTSLVISRKSGGNISEMCDKIARTIRQRNELAAKIRAVTAEGRISAVVLGLLPILLLSAFYFIDQDAVSLLFSTLIGYLILGFCSILEILGVYTVRKILQIDI